MPLESFKRILFSTYPYPTRSQVFSNFENVLYYKGADALNQNCFAQIQAPNTLHLINFKYVSGYLKSFLVAPFVTQ